TAEAIANAGATVQSPSRNFEAAMKLAVEILREPSFPDADFDQIRTQRVRALELLPTEPTQLAPETLQRHLSPFAKGDAMYGPTREELLADMRKVTLDDVKKFHAQFYGASHGELAVAGPIDLAAVERIAQPLLGS